MGNGEPPGARLFTRFDNMPLGEIGGNGSPGDGICGDGGGGAPPGIRLLTNPPTIGMLLTNRLAASKIGPISPTGLPSPS
ncbi:MAG: hypothetical protein ACREA2_08515 [Blastocatellia bacterium]